MQLRVEKTLQSYVFLSILSTFRLKNLFQAESIIRRISRRCVVCGYYFIGVRNSSGLMRVNHMR